MSSRYPRSPKYIPYLAHPSTFRFHRDRDPPPRSSLFDNYTGDRNRNSNSRPGSQSRAPTSASVSPAPTPRPAPNGYGYGYGGYGYTSDARQGGLSGNGGGYTNTNGHAGTGGWAGGGNGSGGGGFRPATPNQKLVYTPLSLF